MPRILNKNVGPMGFGLMSVLKLREAGGPLPDEEAFKVMKAALNNGCNFWTGAEFFGPPENTFLNLVNRYFTKYPEDADRVVLSIKGCFSLTHGPECKESDIRRHVDNCLAVLDGKKFLDIFEPARLDPKVSVEDTVRVLSSYVKEGKVGGIFLSEVRAETIRRAHKIHPISGVEMELSLWATETMRDGVAETCAELEIPVISYSPIGQGMFSGALKSLGDIPKDDMRRHWPRFQPGVFETNLKLAQAAEKLAKAKSCTPAQFAINWSQQRTGRPKGLVVIPIPGASSVSRVEENAKLIEWGDEDEEKIGKVLRECEVVGDRYPEMYARYLEG